MKMCFCFTRSMVALFCLTIMDSCATTDTSVKNYPPIPGIGKVVVLALPRQNAPDRHIENKFTEGLISKKYTVASRYDLPKLMQEQFLQHSSIAESEAAKIGKILNAHAVLIVEVTELEIGRSKEGDYISRVSMAARLINVETANILWIRTKTADSGSLATALIGIPITLIAGQKSKFDVLINEFLEEFPNRY